MEKPKSFIPLPQIPKLKRQDWDEKKITLRDADQNLEQIKPQPPVELHAAYRTLAKTLNDFQGSTYRG